MTPLETALEHYKTALNALEHDDATLTTAQALEILIARDTLQKAIEKEIQISPHLWIELVKQDQRLKKEVYKITESIDLVKYRDTLATSSQAWWWQLETIEPTHPWNKYDGILQVLRVIVWTGNLGLFGALATRFLSGSSGFWEAAAIAFPGILSLLQAQGELTETGRKGFDRLLAKLTVKPHCYEITKLGTSLLITGLLFFIGWKLPSFSEKYKHEAKKYQDQNQLTLAEQNYLKAVELNPKNLDAYCKLATLYQELQDIENAKKYYIIAAKGGNLDAYNNLAYWYIRQNKAAEAVELLEYEGKKLLYEKLKKQEQSNENEKKEYQDFKYHFYKNLGWARFEQKRYEDAKESLDIAIRLTDDPKIFKHIRNPGAAYCLYAQVLEQQVQKPKPFQLSPDIKDNWRKCRDLIKKRKTASNRINPEEDMWLYQAKQKLKEK